MMLTNEIVHYMQQWNYIKIRQTKTKNECYCYSQTVMNCYKIIQNSTKYNNVNICCLFS